MYNRKIMSFKYFKKRENLRFVILFGLVIIFSGCSFTIGTKSSYQSKNLSSYGCYHIVRKGEDLYMISLYYGVPVPKIESANELSSSLIYPGEKLFIPGVNKKQPSYALVPSYEPMPTNYPQQEQIKPETHFYDIIKKKPFIWPVKGKIVGRYGEFGNQGIDIEANNNTNVIAAANGKVEYSGWTEKYGPTIVIVHNNIYTIYGHNITMEVHQGQKIKQGQIIAKINSRYTKGYLHFEIRKKTTSVNPLNYLAEEQNGK